MGVKIRELYPGKWYVLVNWQGRRKTKLVGSKDQAEAVAKKVMTALEIYGFDAMKMFEKKPKPKKLPTVAEYSVTWLAELEKTDLSLSTRNSYRLQTEKHVVPALGTTALDKISYSQAKAFTIEKAKTHSRDSVRLM